MDECKPLTSGTAAGAARAAAAGAGGAAAAAAEKPAFAAAHLVAAAAQRALVAEAAGPAHSTHYSPSQLKLSLCEPTHAAKAGPHNSRYSPIPLLSELEHFE